MKYRHQMRWKKPASSFIGKEVSALNGFRELGSAPYLAGMGMSTATARTTLSCTRRLISKKYRESSRWKLTRPRALRRTAKNPFVGSERCQKPLAALVRRVRPKFPNRRVGGIDCKARRS